MTLCAIGSALLGLIIMGVMMKVSQKYFTRQQEALGDRQRPSSRKCTPATP